MKKITAFLLAILLVCGMSTAAFGAGAAQTTENGTFYLVGTMTEWAIDPACRFERTACEETEEYVLRNIYLTSESQLKAACTYDGTSVSFWLPDGMGLIYPAFSEGWYDVYLRPYADGDDSWYSNVLFFDGPSAAPGTAPLYKEKLLDRYSFIKDGLVDLYYRELYYHHPRFGGTDWALVNVATNMEEPMPLFCIVGNRVLDLPGRGYPFTSGQAVYDVRNDRFIDITAVNISGYDGLAEVLDTRGIGRLLGDTDRDNELSIVDATLLQRCETGLAAYPEDDLIDDTYTGDTGAHSIIYYSDFNRDGDRDLADAAALQRYITGIRDEQGKQK